MTAPVTPAAEARDRLTEAVAEMAAGTRDLHREAVAVAEHFRPEFEACRVDGRFPDKAASDRSMRLYSFVVEREREAKRLLAECVTLEQAVVALTALSESTARIAALEAKVARKDKALKPFAAYADPRGYMPADMPVTAGSSLAKRQLTMGDCYAARAALQPNPGGSDA